MKATFLTAAAVLAALGSLSPASANVTAIYTGTVISDYDLTGIFGTVGGTNELVGEQYTATFVFDLSQGIDVSVPAIELEFHGGTHIGFSGTVVSATVTVGNTTVSIPVPSYYSTIYAQNPTYPANGNFGLEEYDAQGGDVDTPDLYATQESSAVVEGYSGTLPYTLTGPFIYTIDSADYGIQTYSNYAYELNTALTIQNTYVQANVSTLTISSGVPEPATWTMILAGFAVLGFAGYRRRKTTNAVLA